MYITIVIVHFTQDRQWLYLRPFKNDIQEALAASIHYTVCHRYHPEQCNDTH